jgi:acetyltransferase (GNAT) family protein
MDLTPRPENENRADARFRSYRKDDRQSCLQLFDQNCPASFAPNERDDYEQFLDEAVDRYEVCLMDGQVMGAYGVYADGPNRLALRWIIVSTAAQRCGLGSMMMSRIVAGLRESEGVTLRISASHKSAPFFAKFGARERATIPDGWGPGMHRVEMELLP